MTHQIGRLSMYNGWSWISLFCGKPCFNIAVCHNRNDKLLLSIPRIAKRSSQVEVLDAASPVVVFREVCSDH
jgi:hypothetical protein